MTDNSTADNHNDDDHHPVDDEPNWEEIMQHDPSRSEVSAFLSARRRRDEANERFATGLDILHDSVQQSMDGLVEIVNTLLNDRATKLYEYEVKLKNDYVHNEKTRANMQAKLEESARAAQGLFANLLMRVAKPGDTMSGAIRNSENSCNNVNGMNNYDTSIEGGDVEPDWNAIMMHEPARSEVPTFLDARNRREAACSRFESAIEGFQASVADYAQELTQAMADVYNSRTTRLDEYEQILKHDYIANDEMRTKMRSEIEESATAANDMFEELMKRVMQPQLQRSLATGSFTQAVTLGGSP
ncbi:hypothetical protein ACHAXH_004486 [Discostella pseudostelligera]